MLFGGLQKELKDVVKWFGVEFQVEETSGLIIKFEKSLLHKGPELEWVNERECETEKKWRLRMDCK